MKRKDQNCGNCVYGVDVGEIACRRYPPDFLAGEIKDPETGKEYPIELHGFRFVKAAHWCGEWRERVMGSPFFTFAELKEKWTGQRVDVVVGCGGGSMEIINTRFDLGAEDRGRDSSCAFSGGRVDGVRGNYLHECRSGDIEKIRVSDNTFSPNTGDEWTEPTHREEID